METVNLAKSLMDPSQELTGWVKGRSRRDTDLSDTNVSIMRPPRPTGQGERLRNSLAPCRMTLAKLNTIMDRIEEDRIKGLELHKSTAKSNCSLAMLDSFVGNLVALRGPKILYSIDLGGSTIRIVRVELTERAEFSRDQRVYPLSKTGHGRPRIMDKHTTATEMFDDLAAKLRDMIVEFHDDLMEGGALRVGFTFSFNCCVSALNEATLDRWSKEWETGKETDDPVERRDVCLLLQEAFDRKLISAKVQAFANDSVGCLIACVQQRAAAATPCLMSCIIGTGFNICYYEPESKKYGYHSHVINVEVGGFASDDLPLLPVDAFIDRNSENPGCHQLEKLCAGAYLGEVARRLIIEIFQSRTPEGVWEPDSFCTSYVMLAAADNDPRHTKIADLLKDIWDEELAVEDLHDIHLICYAVMDRSAALAAACLTTFARATGSLDTGLAIGIDGSVYLKNDIYRSTVDSYLQQFLGDQSTKITIVPSVDGSGQGSALLAGL